MDAPLLTNLEHFGAWLYNDHLVTCDLNKRHIGIHNQSAAAVWLLLNGAVSIKKLSQKYAEIFAISVEQSRRDVESCLTNWQAQGWVCKDKNDHWQIASTVSEAQDSFSSSNIVNQNELAAKLDTAAVTTIVHCKKYCFGDETFELKVKSFTSLAKDTFAFNFCERLIAVCNGFGQASMTRPIDKFTNSSNGGWVTLTLDGSGIMLEDSVDLNSRYISTELAMAHVYESFLRVSYPHRNVVLTLHAAGVKQPNLCLSLAGISGAGKSTLSAFLAKSGWSLLGDDILAIQLSDQDKPELGLLPFPTAVSLKSGSWPALQSLYPEIEALPTFPYGEKLAKYLAVARHSDSAETPPSQIKTVQREKMASAWDAIVLPRYVLKTDPNKKMTINTLSPAEGLQGLLTAGMSLFGNPSIETVGQALNALISLPCFSIEYADFHEVQACLKDLKRV